MRRLKTLVLMIILVGSTNCHAQTTSTAKPWTFWFWMGSTVNKQEIKQQLNEFSSAGFGGVHIVPVYGVKGFENQFLTFLGEKWLEMVQFTIKQADAMGLGVDVSLGTGWPFGGNWIDRQNAAKKLTIKEYHLNQTARISIGIDTLISNNRFLELIGIIASSDKGERLNLGSRIAENIIDQQVNPGDWTVICLGSSNTDQKVKRAAPGGEGLVIDYFDERALARYLHHFDSVFGSTRFPFKPRAWFHDSYEAYQASWSFRFLDRFKELQGYDFTEYLPVFTDTLNPQRPLIVHDFRETLADLLYSEFALPWTGWSTKAGIGTRYQAHGSPGNLLDLYGLSNIPETESFGCSNFPIPGLKCDPDYEETTFGRPSPLMMKFASSPAHILNKPLVSSETATWLAEHFKESLAMIKPQVDELFVSGINHIFYQGSTYSPKSEGFPGWLFYASTNFGPSAHFWDELPLLNSYITRCQSILQNSKPDNDILLYFPINDLWTRFPGDLLLLLDVHHYSEWFGKSEFGRIAKQLWDNGFTFDYVSDKQIDQLDVQAGGKLSVQPNSSYSVIVVPPVEFINKTTLQKLDSLAQKGANIIFADRLPLHLAGLKAHKNPGMEWTGLKTKLAAKTIVSKNLIPDLRSLNIRQEEIKVRGLDFIRKKNSSGSVYFVTNLGNRFYQDTVSLASGYTYLEVTDPLNMTKGYVQTTGRFFLQLPPGMSCLISCLHKKPQSDPLQYWTKRDTIMLSGPWTVKFISGNNQNLQPVYKIDRLNSWTEWGDDSLKTFCGKAEYVTDFNIKNYDKNKIYSLSFDDIRETARVTINGVDCGTVWALPYMLRIPANVLKEHNRIEIVVQNLSANLIKKIDTQAIPWKKFYDINFVNIKYRTFDASKWDYVPSGLIGKVMLIGN